VRPEAALATSFADQTDKISNMWQVLRMLLWTGVRIN